MIHKYLIGEADKAYIKRFIIVQIRMRMRVDIKGFE